MFENVDGWTTDRRTDARVTGILLATFGSGELIYRKLFCDSYEIISMASQAKF